MVWYDFVVVSLLSLGLISGGAGMAEVEPDIDATGANGI